MRCIHMHIFSPFHTHFIPKISFYLCIQVYFPWFLVTAVFCLTFQVLGAFWSIIGPWSMHGRLRAQQRLHLGPFHTSCGLTGPSCGLQEVPTCGPSGLTSPGHSHLSPAARRASPAARRPNMEMPAVQNRLQVYKRQVFPPTWGSFSRSFGAVLLPGDLRRLWSIAWTSSSRHRRDSRSRSTPARQIRGSRVLSLFYS